jgi:tyrosyl-tRNA synthetase
MTDLLNTLRARGFVQDVTPGLADRLRGAPLTAYVGFDPTADSLHVGSLVPVMGLAWLQRSGHTPIALVGGGTGMVGDPSGKADERPMLGLDQIDRNAEGIARQLSRVLTFEGSNAARMRNNADWLRGIRLMEFLRDTGKHFTLAYMLQKESVRSRMERGISYTEFSYMLIQAYDYWHLHRTERCELQMGGSDQWGNITAGIELISRREGVQVHGLVFPLLTNASGSKFGKSEGGNVWLDPARTTPYHFYQFWVNTEDADVGRFLRFFTFFPEDEIKRLTALEGAELRSAKEILATEVTRIVHGEAAAEEAKQAARALFGGAGGSLEAVPTTAVPAERLEGGIDIADLLVLGALASSKGVARQLIRQGGVTLGERRVDQANVRVQREQFGSDGLLVRAGKKRFHRFVVAN